jgi:hypothetical protein
MGSIIMVVAVLDIHMDINAVPHMNPITTRAGEVPKSDVIVRAIRRCRPHFSIARAIMNPPMKSNSGKRTMGKIDVTGIGRHNDTQKQAIIRTTPAVAEACGDISNPGMSKTKTIKSKMPETRPIVFPLVNLLLSALSITAI